MSQQLVARFSAHALALLGALGLCACSASYEAAPFRSPRLIARLAELHKLAFLPPQVAIERDGHPLVGGGAENLELALESHVTRVLASTHRDVRYVFTGSEQAAETARQVRRWLSSIDVCAARQEVVSAELATVPSVAAPLGADAVVLLDARVFVDSTQHKALQAAAATLITAAAIAATVLIVYALTDPDIHLDLHADAAAAVSKDILEASDVIARSAVSDLRSLGPTESDRRMPTCAKRIELSGGHEHGFWTTSHLDLAVAVVASDGELLWYRDGALPLVVGDARNSARKLSGFLAGMP